MSAPNTVVVAIENNGATQTDRVRSVSSAETAAIITWQQLTVTAKDSKGNNKELLKDVCGYVEPGHMLAIMGPSGCGKTTMLDTLAGRLPGSLSIAGEVLINGYKSNLCYGKSAYVTQSESLIGTLSVQEALTYAALLRLPSSMSYAEKVDRVAEVLNEMGLSDAKHTLIGNWYLKGISGGQKRRLSIACELVTHPTLLFLDEPTSGLDAASAFYVMATIRRLAERGRTVLTVIHQPSSEVFDLFDQLCLLSKGNVVYFGAADQALDMFEAAGMPCPMLRNPTDHFLHMINDDFHKDEAKEVGQLLQRVMSDKASTTASQAAARHHGMALATVADDTHATGDGNTAKLLNAFNSKLRPHVAFKAKELSARTVEYQGNQNQAGFMYQNYVLTKRMLLNNLRNIGVFWLRLAMFIILCIMMGTIYLRLGKSYKDTYSYTSMLFFCVAFLTFMAIAGFPTFAEDMEIFIAERMNGYYGVLTFVIANTIASAPFLFLIAVLSTIIVYWLVNLNDQGDRFPYFFINLYTALTVVESLMMAIAAIVPHFLMGIAMGAGMLGMFMLVCGFFQPVSQLPAPVWHYPLHYMSFHSYNFGGFMQNQFLDTYGWGCQCSETAQGCDATLYNATHPCTMTGQEVLDWWTSGAGTLNKWVDIGILWAMVFIYRAIFFFMLKLKERLRSG